MSNELRNRHFLSDLEDLVRFAIESDVDLDTIRWGLDNYGADLEGWKQDILDERAEEEEAKRKVDELLAPTTSPERKRAFLLGERQAAAEAEPIKDYADKHGE